MAAKVTLHLYRRPKSAKYFSINKKRSTLFEGTPEICKLTALLHPHGHAAAVLLGLHGLLGSHGAGAAAHHGLLGLGLEGRLEGLLLRLLREHGLIAIGIGSLGHALGSGLHRLLEQKWQAVP